VLIFSDELIKLTLGSTVDDIQILCNTGLCFRSASVTVFRQYVGSYLLPSKHTYIHTHTHHINTHTQPGLAGVKAIFF